MVDLSSLEENLLRRAVIGDIPKRTASRFPTKTAIVFQDKRITFKELNQNACRMAHAFEKLGCMKGDRVCFMTHNCLQYIYAWLGLSKIGAIVVPMNFMLKGAEVEYIVNHCGPKAFFVEDSLIPQMKDVAPNLKTVENFGYIPLTGAESPEGWLNIDELFASSADSSEPLVEIDDEDVATILYTSGTEAQPKGVMTTHRNYFITLISGLADLNFRKDDVPLLSIPLYHVAGKYLLLESVNVGATLILEYAPNPVEILELTSREKVTYWIYPPTLYQILPSMPDFANSDLSSLKKCVSFGALMPPALLQQWKEILPQAEWRNYYGQTESSPLGSTLQPEDFERKINTIGTPHIGVDLKIFDDFDNEVPPGTPGEIVMRGPSVMKGYYKDEERTAQTLRGGWLHTGDIGMFDEEGFLYFIDRKKDIIKTGGENVSSQEVESIIFKHEKVMQAAVIGLPHDYWGEMVTAVVVPYPGAEVTEQEIIDYCKEQMAGYKVPKKVIITEQLPVNPSGKILKRELRRELAERFKED